MIKNILKSTIKGLINGGLIYVAYRSAASTMVENVKIASSMTPLMAAALGVCLDWDTKALMTATIIILYVFPMFIK